MKAVILAAGKSTRTYPLTATRPKPLLKVANKTILEHNLACLKGIVDEAIIVVGYKSEMIIEKFGKEYYGIKLTYVAQEENLGTGHALLQAQDCINGHFLVLNGDDIYSKKDLFELSKCKNTALVVEREDVSSFGVFFTKNDLVYDLVEKPKDIEKGLCNIGCFVLEKEIFSLLKNLRESPRGEYELTDAIKELIKQDKFSVRKCKGHWLPITYPWSLLDANELLLENIEGDVKGEIEQNVTIKGSLRLDENSVIMSGVYIEGNVIIGKNCRIGPNTYIRGPTSIGDNCRVGPSEIKASIFFDDCRCDHVSYVGDSVLGEKAHIGAHTVIANLRHDKKTHRSMVKGELMDTKRRKLGVIMGDDTDTGINTSFYPARKMWPGTFTVPGEIVKRDIMEVQG
ncbi:MAG: bifunctional sugar-1-phosphate nucleotidylyltransferase/acetyltransferase [Nanoarchaeota archaeon]